MTCVNILSGRLGPVARQKMSGPYTFYFLYLLQSGPVIRIAEKADASKQ